MGGKAIVGSDRVKFNQKSLSALSAGAVRTSQALIPGDDRLCPRDQGADNGYSQW